MSHFSCPPWKADWLPPTWSAVKKTLNTQCVLELNTHYRSICMTKRKICFNVCLHCRYMIASLKMTDNWLMLDCEDVLLFFIWLSLGSRLLPEQNKFILLLFSDILFSKLIMTVFCGLSPVFTMQIYWVMYSNIYLNIYTWKDDFNNGSNVSCNIRGVARRTDLQWINTWVLLSSQSSFRLIVLTFPSADVLFSVTLAALAASFLWHWFPEK